MKKTLLLLVAVLINLLSLHATDEIIVPDASIPQGGQGIISVELNNDQAFTAFQMHITLPEGLTLASVSKGTRMEDSHSLSCEPKTNMITCLSTSNQLFKGNSGELFTITLKADPELVIGTVMKATLDGIKISTTSGETDFPATDINITIADTRICFNENDTKLPIYTAGEKGNVRMTRTIKAGNWSTIVLPFTLTKTKAEAAFGEDVELAEFSGFQTEYADEEDITPDAITINFTTFSMTAKKGMTGGKLFLIRTSKDITSFDADEATLCDAVTEVSKSDEYDTAGKFTGSLIKTTVPADGLFLSGNKFYYSTGKTNIKAFRGWFELDAVLDKKTDFGVKFFVDGVDTRVDDIAPEIHNDDIYDLSGRKVNKPQQRGVYIINGKKAFVK